VTVPDRQRGDPLDTGVVAGKFTETSYEPPAGLKYDQWLDIVATFGRMARSCQWWIGDTILFGDRKYGETYAAAEEATGLDPGTLSNIVSVCDRIEKPRRRGNLSFSHHAEVAYLDERDADLLLDQAEEKGWGVRRLRDANRQLSAGAAEPEQMELDERDDDAEAEERVCECCGQVLPCE
jgi:hypothetical protein